MPFKMVGLHKFSGAKWARLRVGVRLDVIEFKTYAMLLWHP